MSQWAFLPDENGDLVNLYRMETIQISPPDPDSGTRVVIAVPPGNGEEGYVLHRGDEESCKEFLARLAHAIGLDMIRIEIHPPAIPALDRK